MTPAASRVVRARLDFGGEAAGAVAADGFADFGEGGAGGGFYVGDLVAARVRVVSG